MSKLSRQSPIRWRCPLVPKTKSRNSQNVTILTFAISVPFGSPRFVSPCNGDSVYLDSTAVQPPGCASLTDQSEDALMVGVAFADIVAIVSDIGHLVVLVGLRPGCLDDGWHRRTHRVRLDSRG